MVGLHLRIGAIQSAAVIAPVLALAACTSSPPPPFDPQPLDPLHDSPAIDVPAELLVDSSAPPSQEPKLGDCAVYSLTIHEPEKPPETWFVRTAIAALDKSATGTATFTPDTGGPPLEIELHGAVTCHLLVTDASGNVVGESKTSALPAEVLGVGFGPMAEIALATPDLTPDERFAKVFAMPTAERRRALISMFAIRTIIELVLGAEPLAPLLERAVQKPSLLTAALNFTKGIEMNFGVDGTRVWPHPTPIGKGEHCVFPIEVTAYGERALEASMVVTRGIPPAPITVGVASVAAVHPGNRDVNVRLRLQATGTLRPVEWARVVIGSLEKE